MRVTDINPFTHNNSRKAFYYPHFQDTNFDTQNIELLPYFPNRIDIPVGWNVFSSTPLLPHAQGRADSILQSLQSKRSLSPEKGKSVSLGTVSLEGTRMELQ